MKSVLLLLLLLPIASASMDVGITLSKNGFVQQDIALQFEAEESYDSFEFVIPKEPISVEYDGTYMIEDNTITFNKDIQPGLNRAQFTLYYDDVIDEMGTNKIYRTTFEHDGNINIAVILPKRYILAQNPGATPSPTAITSDGQHIIVVWHFEDMAAFALFYQGEESIVPVLLIGIIVVVIAGILVYLYTNKKVEDRVADLLTTSEQKVLDQIKQGVKKQTDIAKNLGYSKSKMSKVVRKLEEKDLITKKPHFRTNKLEIK